MQMIRFLLLAFMDFIAAIFIGVFLGFTFGLGIIGLQEWDVLKSWRSLNSPVKFVEIVDASAFSIVAQSDEGKLYEWNNWACQMEQICTWNEINNVNIYKDELSTVVRKDVCQHENFAPPRRIPGNVIECVFTSEPGSEIIPSVYYAILDDGSIWSWPRSKAYGNEYPNFLVMMTVLGAVTGMVSGSIVVVRKENSSKYD